MGFDDLPEDLKKLRIASNKVFNELPEDVKRDLEEAGARLKGKPKEEFKAESELEVIDGDLIHYEDTKNVFEVRKEETLKSESGSSLKSNASSDLNEDENHKFIRPDSTVSLGETSVESEDSVSSKSVKDKIKQFSSIAKKDPEKPVNRITVGKLVGGTLEEFQEERKAKSITTTLENGKFVKYKGEKRVQGIPSSPEGMPMVKVEKKSSQRLY